MKFIDGAYTDNTSVCITLSQMIKKGDKNINMLINDFNFENDSSLKYLFNNNNIKLSNIFEKGLFGSYIPPCNIFDMDYPKNWSKSNSN